MSVGADMGASLGMRRANTNRRVGPSAGRRREQQWGAAPASSDMPAKEHRFNAETGPSPSTDEDDAGRGRGSDLPWERPWSRVLRARARSHGARLTAGPRSTAEARLSREASLGCFLGCFPSPATRALTAPALPNADGRARRRISERRVVRLLHHALLARLELRRGHQGPGFLQVGRVGAGEVL